jgi:uncharacterized protein YbjQ (UPF0145 family)
MFNIQASITREMAMRRILFIMSVALAGCATSLTDGAARIRVIQNDSPAAKACTQLGSVAGRSKGLLFESAAKSKAMADLLDAAANMGADTVAIVKTTEAEEVITLYGVALKCL